MRNSEEYVHQNSIEKRKKKKQKRKIADLVIVADFKKMLPKSGATNWSQMLCEVTKITMGTKPSYRKGVVGKAYGLQSEQLPERSNEALLKTGKFSIKENNIVLIALDFYCIKGTLAIGIHCY